MKDGDNKNLGEYVGKHDTGRDMGKARVLLATWSRNHHMRMTKWRLWADTIGLVAM